MHDIKPEDLDPPLLPEDCPISSLLGKRVSQMNDAELEVFTNQMRTARESPQVLRSLLAAGSRKKKESAPKKPLDLSIFDL